MSRFLIVLPDDSADMLERLRKAVHHDWENSRPLDLSDEGLLPDLKNRRGESLESLVLEHDKKHDCEKTRSQAR